MKENKTNPEVASSSHLNGESEQLGSDSGQLTESGFQPGALTPQQILTLQRTIGNKAVQRLIKEVKEASKQTEARTDKGGNNQIQRLMTKAQWQAQTPKFWGGTRGRDNPVILKVDKWLDDYHKTPTISDQAKLKILKEMSEVKDWLSKASSGNKRRAAFTKLSQEIDTEYTSLNAAPAEPNPFNSSGATISTRPRLVLNDGGVTKTIINKGTPREREFTADRTEMKPAVEELQIRLNSLDKDLGLAVTGIFDKATEDAVMKFRRDNALPADDRDKSANKDVWNKLDEVGSKSNKGFASYRFNQNRLGQEQGSDVRYLWEIKADKMEVTVKIYFTGDKGGGIIDKIKQGVATVWNRFKIVNQVTKASIELEFKLEDAPSKSAQTAEVQLVNGDGRSDSGKWYLKDSDLQYKTAPHEFGHILGLEDEYGRAHTDYFNLTGRNPLIEKTGLTPKKTEDCAKELNAVLITPLDTKDATTKMNSAVDILKKVIGILNKYDLYRQTGKGWGVLQKYQELYNIDIISQFLPLYTALKDGPGSWDTKIDVTSKLKLPKSELYEYSVNQFSFESKSIMGDMSNATPEHEHGTEPRHVRAFVDKVQQFKGGVWKAEHR